MANNSEDKGLPSKNRKSFVASLRNIHSAPRTTSNGLSVPKDYCVPARLPVWGTSGHLSERVAHDAPIITPGYALWEHSQCIL